MADEKDKLKKKPSIEDYQDEIRKRAEELCKARTDYSGAGDTLSDWLQAEKEIKQKYGL